MWSRQHEHDKYHGNVKLQTILIKLRTQKEPLHDEVETQESRRPMKSGTHMIPRERDGGKEYCGILQ